MRIVLAFFLAIAASTAWAQDAPPPPAPPAPAPAAEAAPAPAPEAAAPAPAPPPPPPAVPILQVQIQTWISETGEQGLRDIGANLNYTRFISGSEMAGNVERISTNVFEPRKPQYTVTLPAPDTNPSPDNLRPDQSGTLADNIQTQSGAGLNFSLIESGSGTINGLFRGVEQRSDLDLISKPELLVINAMPAEIHAGQEVPFQSVDYTTPSRPALTVKWEKIGVDISVTPTIMSPELVKIDLTDLKVSDRVGTVNTRGVDLPVFSTRSQTGIVLVPNSQTLVIGGLSSRVVRKTERRVPILGKIPIVGIPFRGRNSNARNNHLLIFLSPTIVDLRVLPTEAIDALNFWREEKWKNTDRIEREIEVMEQEL